MTSLIHTIEEREQYKKALYDTIEHSSHYPEGRFRGRGIVTVAGGVSYLAGAWASFSILRAMKVDLPMQLWFFGEGEFDGKTRALFSEIGVECVDIQKVLNDNPMKNLSPEHALQRRFALFEMKCYSMLHSSFEEVLFLDADNIALQDPRPLFDDSEYLSNGVMFWPDPSYGAKPPDEYAWAACGLPPQSGPSFESGQILINKRQCWAPLQVTWWMNEESDYWFTIVYGDKDTYKLVWHAMHLPYAIAPAPRSTLLGVIQHDMAGHPMFYHRWFMKPSLRSYSLGTYIASAHVRRLFVAALKELRSRWDGRFWCEDTIQLQQQIVGVYDFTAHGRCSLVLLKLDGTIVPHLPRACFWHTRTRGGHTELVLQGTERVLAFLSPRDLNWSGIALRGSGDVILKRTEASLVAIMFLYMRSAVMFCARYVRFLFVFAVRMIELVLIMIVGDRFAGTLRAVYRRLLRACGVTPRH